MTSITERTRKALGGPAIGQLESLSFCIVGCGGTGANFAEMLVRTGATRLTLVDGSEVQGSSLNRVFSFLHADIGAPKVNVLKRHLEAIRPDKLEIMPIRESFRDPNRVPINEEAQMARDAVHDASVVFIATDTRVSRLAIQELYRNRARPGRLLSCGVHIDRANGIFEFECNWSPRNVPLPVGAEEVGYGPENASYAAILLEATSVAFAMLMSNLSSPDSDFKYYKRRYDACFRPVETLWECEIPNGGVP